MPNDTLPGTENMKCAIGLYEGSREYVDGPFKGTKVYGVFSYVDVSDEPCDKPVRFWCKRKGSNHAWLACDNPEHQRDAEMKLELNPEYIAFLVWQQNPGQPMPEALRNRTKRNPFLDAPKKLVEAAPEPKLLPPKKRHKIPRNKPKTNLRAKSMGDAAKIAGGIMTGIMGLVEKGKDKR